MTEILAALPGRSGEEAVRAAEGMVAGGFVVGIDLLAGPGPALVSGLARLGPVLVLAGLHGDPADVAAAARRFAEYGARWVSVQAIDGAGSVAAVAEAGVTAVAVTLRRGQTDAEVASLRLGQSRGRTVSRLAEVAFAAGAGGILCDPRDLGVVAQVAPGVDRFVGVSSPREATDAATRGAEFLIVESGRVPQVRAVLG